MKYIALIAVGLVCLALNGCTREAERSVGSTNPKFEVEKLFTDEDGNTVHRFFDSGHYVYYVTGPAHASAVWEERVGKNQTVHHQVDTAR